jgi:flavin reductase (DIM6/NTAB) family NADH-FMN oxidoreductase RutF
MLMSPDDFDKFVTQLDASLVVVTASSDDQQAGCVVGFHTQCSIEPRRYAVWLSKANLTYRVSLFATHLAVHLLAEDDRSLLQLFGGTSGDRTEKFALCDWSPGPGGVPLLTACPTRAVLEITSRWDDGSDHACVVGTPIIAEWTPTTPMRASEANDTEGGHDATERATPERLTAADQTATHPDPMDDSTRHELESAAAGSGHAVDLSGRDEEADR